MFRISIFGLVTAVIAAVIGMVLLVRAMRLSIFAVVVLVAAAAVIGMVLLVAAWRRRLRRQSQRFGYASTHDYLRAAPRSDEEKRDAVDLAVKGLVICFVGLIFPPIILVGAFPLFYGARKMAYSSMGLGLVDDSLLHQEERPGG